ncbi:hypothetical protein Fmac_002277 [Flemingia macrophylla]|uniref:Uncharacterized protein n=1 Tax=Flemingia macrophylla TaxID=520843 RepID=A0ABD1NJH3_9FABA
MILDQEKLDDFIFTLILVKVRIKALIVLSFEVEGFALIDVTSGAFSFKGCFSAFVEYETWVKRQGIYAFVTIVDGVPHSEQLRKDLILMVQNQLEGDEKR